MATHRPNKVLLGATRPAAVVNRWLRELPASGVPSANSWAVYARAVKEWTEFLAEHGVGLFDSRERLKSGLSRYAEHRATGPLARRFAATTWSQHVSILSLFYRWALDEGYARAEPFTYRSARALFGGTGREVRVNLAVRRTPKPHVTAAFPTAREHSVPLTLTLSSRACSARGFVIGVPC